MQLRQDAPEAPHVDLRVVGGAQQNLRRAVVARLHVHRVFPRLVREARAAEVHQHDLRRVGRAQKHVLQLHVAVDHGLLRQKRERVQELAGDAAAHPDARAHHPGLARPETRPSRRVGGEPVSETHRDELEHQAPVPSKREDVQQLDAPARAAERAQRRDFNLHLFVEPRRVPHHLDRDALVPFVVEALRHLGERALADDALDLVPVRQVVPGAREAGVIQARIRERPTGRWLARRLPRRVPARGRLRAPGEAGEPHLRELRDLPALELGEFQLSPRVRLQGFVRSHAPARGAFRDHGRRVRNLVGLTERVARRHRARRCTRRPAPAPPVRGSPRGPPRDNLRDPPGCPGERPLSSAARFVVIQFSFAKGVKSSLFFSVSDLLDFRKFRK